MVFFQSHSAAFCADKLHGCQFVCAHVCRFYFLIATKSAGPLVSAGVAQMSGLLGNGAACLTGIFHGVPPFRRSVKVSQRLSGYSIVKEVSTKGGKSSLLCFILSLQTSRDGGVVSPLYGAKCRPKYDTS